MGIFLGNLSMREMLVMASRTSFRPPVQTVGVEVVTQESLWGRECSAIFLGWKSHGSIAFGNLRLFGGKSD